MSALQLDFELRGSKLIATTVTLTKHIPIDKHGNMVYNITFMAIIFSGLFKIDWVSLCIYNLTLLCMSI